MKNLLGLKKHKMNDIIVFTLYGCSHCLELKDRLKQEKIIFQDVEITKNRELWNDVVSQTGYDILPTIFIQTDDIGNGVVYIPGRDFQNFDDLMEKIKKKGG